MKKTRTVKQIVKEINKRRKDIVATRAKWNKIAIFFKDQKIWAHMPHEILIALDFHKDIDSFLEYIDSYIEAAKDDV